jgi:hypothetical protein
MTHLKASFNLEPAEDGECMLDFDAGTYTILAPTADKRRRKRPDAQKGEGSVTQTGEGPYPYHVQRCEAAARALGFREVS